MRRARVWVAAGILVLVILGFFLAFGPPQLFARSETPEFCGRTCHPMEAEYQAWFQTGAHRGLLCVDCHLPNHDLPGHLVQKAIDGVHDVADYTSGRIPPRIELSARGSSVVQANCIRCHDGMTRDLDRDRACWTCHRRFSHRFGGVVDVRTP